MWRSRYFKRLDRRGLPDWLFDEKVSPFGPGVDKEWRRLATGSLGEDEGMSRLIGAMTLLRSQRPRRPLLAEANSRALRWVDRTLRESREAAALRKAAPQLPWRVRLLAPLQRVAIPLACWGVVVICRLGVLNLLEGVCKAGSRLARLHTDRHIGPMF